MKTNILFFLFLCINLSLNAQDDLMQILSDETCLCLDGFDMEGKTQDEIQMGMGVCMMEKASPYLDRINSEMGIDLINDGEAGGRKLGERLGMKLSGECPAFQKIIKLMLEDDKFEANDIKLHFGTFSGEITEFKNNGFMNIVAKKEGERPQRFLWLEYFDGSENIIGNFEKYIGKTVEIEYEKIEVFMPEAGDYFEVKKITSVKFK